MALFCSAIWTDSVSLLRFPFLSHIQVFLYEMLLISRLKRPLSCFSFCFLVIVLSVTFLVAVISSPSSFSMLSSSSIDASTLFSMLVNPLPPSFLDTYILTTSSLGCNALCMVISVLVLWSICLRSSLVIFKNGPKYLTAPVFIALIRFILHSFVSSSFLVLLRYSFLINYHHHHHHFTNRDFLKSSICDSPAVYYNKIFNLGFFGLGSLF